MSERVALTEEDDAALVARCLEDDRDAWAALVRRHGPVVWTVARRTGLSHEDASDVYQTVWLVAVEALGRLRRPESFGSWIARTAHLQALRALRDHGIARRALARIPATDCDGRRPDDDAITVEDRRRVHEALAAIGERCRALLRLLYFEQPTPSYAEVGARLAMPIGSIGPTRARCLARLESQIAGRLDARRREEERP